MTLAGWVQILVFFGLTAAVTKPLGLFMYRVFETGEEALGWAAKTRADREARGWQAEGSG